MTMILLHLKLVIMANILCNIKSYNSFTLLIKESVAYVDKGHPSPQRRMTQYILSFREVSNTKIIVSLKIR